MPAAILTGCTSLGRLSLHNNPITLEALRQGEGFAAYDARRRAKADKQVCIRKSVPFASCTPQKLPDRESVMQGFKQTQLLGGFYLELHSA